MRSPSRLFHGEIGVVGEQALRAIIPSIFSRVSSCYWCFTYNSRSELCRDVAWTELDDIVPEVEKVALEQKFRTI